MPTPQRTLSCKVDDAIRDQIDQQAQEQGLTRGEWVKQAIETVVSGNAEQAPDHSRQILQAIQRLDQRMQQLETKEVSVVSPANPDVGDERLEQVLQWLQVIGQRLQRLEEKEEEPMITQAQLVAPDERIDEILQMVQGLGQQVRHLEAHTEDAVATAVQQNLTALQPAVSETKIGLTEPSTSTPPTVPAFESPPAPAPMTPELKTSAEPDSGLKPETAETASPSPAVIGEANLISLEQLYAQTALDRQALLFFADYLGISEIEAIETRTHWEYDYMAGGFRSR